MPDPTTITAHGKLLITGEYAVLDGARALAAPTRFGQRFTIAETASDRPFTWSSHGPDGARWLHLEYDPTEHYAAPRMRGLVRVLRRLDALRPGTIRPGIRVRSDMDFDPRWGLGSSSTLVYALATWAGVSPFDLNTGTFNSSGYDVACAGSDGPILYQNRTDGPVWDRVAWRPPFADRLYIVYLGRKMDSRRAIERYRSRDAGDGFIERIDALTDAVLAAGSLTDFERTVRQHEHLVGERIGLDPIGSTLFADWPGVAKSLGGWGGDMALLSGPADTEAVCDDLAKRGFDTVFTLQDILR